MARLPAPNARFGPREGARAAFTVMEMIVVLAILTVVLVAALMLLDTTNRVTRAQLDRSGIQQSVRTAQDEMARKLRLAGRGGLPAESDVLTLPRGIAVRVENNVEAHRTLFRDDVTSPRVAEATDILTVRGIFDSPLYQLRPLNRDSYSFDVSQGTGTVRIFAVTESGFPQDLQFLEEERQDANPGDAVVIVSPYNDDVYGVAEVDWAGSRYSAGSGTFTLAFRFESDRDSIDPNHPVSSVAAVSVLSSGGAFPKELFRSGFKTLGLLQEYRYFVRDVEGEEIARFPTPPRLSLSRTRVNQDQFWKGLEYEDVAEDVIDLQIALGFSDAEREGGEVVETADGRADSWFLNAAGEDVPPGNLALVRCTSLVRSATPLRQSGGRPMFRLEDHTYGQGGVNTDLERRYRRLFLPTVVDLRNL